MSDLKPTTQESSIVLVGSFNPAIYHPEWFLRNGLISEDDLKDQEIEIIHNDLSRFSFAWLSAQIQDDKFVLRTNDPSQFSPLRDLVVSVFTILEHTPIVKLGMNYLVTYNLEKEEDWHKVGDTLAPKTIWEKTLKEPVGMMSLSVGSPREDDFDGIINVTVGPVMTKSMYGINVSVNNHIEVKEKEASLSIPTILLDHWDKAIAHAKSIAETTIREALKK